MGNWDSASRRAAAQRWEQPSAVMGRGVTDALVEAAQVAPGMRVLDVASGTGEPALTIADRIVPDGSVVATDLASESLMVAAERARRRGLHNLAIERADVQALPFDDDSFDRVTCRFGLMFFPDLDRALREMRRVLKPGGRASFAVWGPFEQPYFQSTVGVVMQSVPAAPLPPMAAAMFKFGRAGALSSALARAGFVKAEEEFQHVPWLWPESVEELWAYFQQVTVPFRPLFESIPAEKRHEVNAKVHDAIGAYFDGRQVNFRATIVVASAHRARE